MTDEATQTSEAPAADAQRTEAEAAAEAAQAAAAEGADGDKGKAPAKTIATDGADPGAAGAGEGEGKKPEGNDTGWSDDWRQRLAGDNKAALKTLERFTSPDALFGAYSDLRSRLDSGDYIRRPGKDASDEDKAAFAKAMGVPETPDAYVDNLELPEGQALSKEDKEVLGSVGEYAHKAGVPQSGINAMAAWYLDHQAKQAEALDVADAETADKARQELQEEWGPADFKRNVRAGQLLFTDAPGGTDAADGLYQRLMNGRMADGTVIGNDPNFLRWMAAKGREMNPAVTVTGSTDGTPASVETRIAELEGLMKAGDPKYWKDDKAQQEYRELLDARQKLKERG